MSPEAGRALGLLGTNSTFRPERASGLLKTTFPFTGCSAPAEGTPSPQPARTSGSVRRAGAAQRRREAEAMSIKMNSLSVDDSVWFSGGDAPVSLTACVGVVSGRGTHVPIARMILYTRQPCVSECSMKKR